jgi:hypothetical protein
MTHYFVISYDSKFLIVGHTMGALTAEVYAEETDGEVAEAKRSELEDAEPEEEHSH